MVTREPVPPALKRFIWDIQSVVELADSEREILLVGGDLMARLIASDDWLPPVFATEAPDGPQQFQLYADGEERFSVVSTVLAGGQAVPIYHDPVWEIIGLLRGAMTRQRFALSEDGQIRGKAKSRRLQPGTVELSSPKTGEAVQLSNALGDRVSIAIHVHGGEIGKLARRTLAPGKPAQAVVSGYANTEACPPYDIWSIQTYIKD